MKMDLNGKVLEKLDKLERDITDVKVEVGKISTTLEAGQDAFKDFKLSCHERHANVNKDIDHLSASNRRLWENLSRAERKIWWILGGAAILAPVVGACITYLLRRLA